MAASVVSSPPVPDGLDVLAREAVAELGTIADLVRWGAARLDGAGVAFGHGTGDAVDEAMVLVLHAAGLRPGPPEPLFASRLTTRERRAAVGLIVRRIRERVPAPYLTGRAWFAGLELACDGRALVPRSPIAEWIERGFEPWLDPDAVERVLEIGTGGGAIAIACAMAFPGRHDRRGRRERRRPRPGARELCRPRCRGPGAALALGRLCRGARGATT